MMIFIGLNFLNCGRLSKYMLRLIQSLLLFFLVLIISNCNKTTGPNDSNPEPTETDYSNFHFTITDFTEVVFKNNDDLISDEKDVEKISVGCVLTEIDSVELDSAPSIYTKVDSGYRLEFELTINEVDYINSRDYFLQFHMIDGSLVRIDTTVDFSKYPYGDRVLFLSYDAIGTLEYYGTDIYWAWLSDFDIMDSYIYFNPQGIWGIYRYNYLTDRSENLTENFHNSSLLKAGKQPSSQLYPNGEHLAVTKDYIFCDYNGSVYRYNLDADSVDVKIDYTQLNIPGFLYPFGIKADINSLFILFIDENNEYLLATFTYSGDLIDVVNIKNGSWNIDSYNGVLYLWDASLDELLRLDIESMDFLNNVIAPAPIINDGFDILDGNFYYGDDYSRSIYVLPLDSLREIE